MADEEHVKRLKQGIAEWNAWWRDDNSTTGPDLSDANLRSADLSYAYLWSANLRSANLRSANLEGANLEGAALSAGRPCCFRFASTRRS
jgi:uncharacterized protein YjbI with pentapeptide repeats